MIDTVKSMKTRAKENLKELARPEPNLNELREEFIWCLERRDSTIFRRQRLNWNTRYCYWPGQTLDGKKWYGVDGRDPFPWKGASDARVPLIDMYINQDVAMDMVTWQNMRTLVTSNNGADPALGTRLTQVLRWMKYTQMKEAEREACLLANYRYERGVGVLGIFWEKRSQLGYDELDMETIRAVAMQVEQAVNMRGGNPNEGEELLIALPRTIMDPSLENEAVEIAAMQYPDVKADRLRKVVRDLRTAGYARFPRPYLVQDRPTIVALCPNEDIFIPPETIDLQTARSIHRRELLTETQLRERVQTCGWQQSWVDQMIATMRGKVTLDFDGSNFRRQPRLHSGGVWQTAKLFEVVHSFQRLADEEGVPGLYYTVFNPGLTEASGYHEMLNYDHGEYPFVLFERESRSRLIDDSRGYGEIGSTWQAQIKAEWDSRTDLASIRTLPPSYYPEGAPPDAWGPGVQIPTSRPEDYGFMDVPGSTGEVSREVQQNVREFADEYFARSPDPEKAVMTGIMRQYMTNKWLSSWTQADTQILQLMQQYMPDQFYFRVVGSNKGKPIHATREEIQGKFDVALSFNSKTFDPEYVQREIELVEKMLSVDVNGRMDRDEVMIFIGELIDPNLSERLIKPGEEATQHEIEDERNAFAQMFAGLQPDVKPGQAHQLRLSWLENNLRTNPMAAARLQEDEQFRATIERRIQQFQFQIQQRQINPIIGRDLGTKPSPQNMPGMAGMMSATAPFGR